MSSLFGSREGYSRLSQTEISRQDEDVRLLDGEECADDQATFNVDRNTTMDPVPGPSTSVNLIDDDTEIAYNIPGENGRIEFLDIHDEPLQRQFSITEQHLNVETEENLKCVVSSLLFVAVVVTVLLVAFLINPSI